MTYQIGASYAGLANAGTIFGTAITQKDPRSVYSPGQRAETHAGTIVHAGYPRSMWFLAPITIATWGRIKAMLAQYSYSGTCWIKTRDDEDNWFIAECVVRLPDISQLDRAGGKYIGVALEFIILERWDLILFTFHEGGTLAANQTYYLELPYAWKFYGIKASASNNSDATLAASGGVTIAAAVIGDSGDPAYLQPTSYPVDVAADTLVTLTLDYDGAGGTAAQNVSIIVVAAASL